MADEILTSLSASNMFDLRGLVAVVTGGGSGIGTMISSTLVANGATVFIVGPKQEELDRVAEKYNEGAAKELGRGRMHAIQADIRFKAEAKRLAEEIEKRVGYVTVLFNNAGILTGSNPAPGKTSAEDLYQNYFEAVTQEDFDNVLRTNAVGPYWLTFAFLPLFEKWKNSGLPAAKKFVPQVIMTSSMNGWTKDPATAGYSFPYLYSKSAIGHATSTLAHELLPLGIRVNGIAPGLFVTQMSVPGEVNELGQRVLPPKTEFGFQIPTVPTGGTNRDMGALVLFLVANWYVNGETVLIDGGTLLKHPSSY